MAAIFDIKSVNYPSTITTDTDFKVTGEVTLFDIRYFGLPLWVAVTVTYPSGWLDLLGGKQTAHVPVAWFGSFSADFPKGFGGEGDYTLDIRAYLGPTIVATENLPILGGISATIPPIPSVVIYPKQKFTVAGKGVDKAVKQSVVYNDGKTQVTSGQPVTAKINWKNTNIAAMKPQFRVDIQGTGLFDTPLEGTWVDSPSVNAGAAATISVSSIPIPKDWQNGKQLNAYVLLNGVSGHWDTSPLLTVYVPGSVVGAVTKQSVVYNNNQSNINSGQPISVQITWKNTGTSSVTPRFRVDIQGTGLFDTPLEGTWVDSPSVDAGATATISVSSIPIPTDWQNGKTLNAYVMLDGVSGHWDEAPALFTVVKGGGAAGAITKQSVVYNNNQSNINSGQPISVQITWKNTGTASVTPRFRVDIQGTGLFDTPLEGTWVDSPAGSAGGTVTVTASSVAIPTDWQNGKTLNAYVMLDGVSGHWDTSSILFTVVAQGGGGVTGPVTKQSVVYNSNQSNINSGQPINVQITWKNTGTTNINPRFRVDIQGTGFTDTPLEGQWVTSPVVSPGQTVVTNVSSIPIPTDWQNGKTLHAYVMLDGVSGHWDEASILFTVVKGGAGAATLSANYSNGACSYSFSGFQPNATVTLTVTQTGGYVTKTANSSGAGSGSFNDTDPSGNYTLRATDSAGNSATATFTISITGVASVTKQSVVYNNNQGNINSGQPISVQITWKNTGTASITPQFRVDIQGTGLFDSPLEGAWVTSPSVAAGGTATVSVSSIPIPTDWQNGKTLNAYVILNGVNGHWDTSSLLFTVVKGGGAATLSASYSGGVCSYSFSGFQPNATVTLTVTQTGGYVTKTVDSSGAGSGSFNDNDPAGTYTLKAADSYGHSASATFTIGGAGGASL